MISRHLAKRALQGIKGGRPFCPHTRSFRSLSTKAESAKLVRETSWAFDLLETKGEKLAEVPPFESYIVVDDSTLTSPAPHVQSLADEILGLSAESQSKLFDILEV